MANKLKGFPSNITSVNQSAFVPKRLITDNALLAFEAFHAMKLWGWVAKGSFRTQIGYEQSVR